LEKLLDSLKTHNLHTARKLLNDMNVVDIAEFLETIDPKEMLILFRLLPKDKSVEVFAYISQEEKQYLINQITEREVGEIIKDLYLDDTVDFIEELPATVVKRVLKNTPKEKRTLINQYLNYPDETAGSLMTIEYVDLKKKMTVKEAIEHIKETGIDKETIDTCYVTDKERKLEGVTTIRKLILSEEDKRIEDIMDKNLIKIQTLDDQEYVADQFKKYDFFTMPVVDKEERLVGIITIDDIVDVIELEDTEDFHKMASMAPLVEPYLKTRARDLAKNRIIWLLVLMISATFTGAIIRRYENVLETVVILTAFIPMLMDTGGNAGSQSATLVIRSMALGEVEIKDAIKVFIKEFQVSIMVGIILSFINFLRIYYISGASFNISIVVAFTLLFTIVLAKLLGAMLPIFAKVVKLDPAIMAGPLITTIVDATSLIVYFQIAGALLL
jgi:magnesium transporter